MTTQSRLRDGVVTILVMALMFAAFDDITTDNDTDFRFEYTVLLAGEAWLLFVTIVLIRASRWVLGAISAIALIGALWGQSEIGTRAIPGLWPAYAATASAILWFVVVGVVLCVSGLRHRALASRTTP